jgi:hypothetical protein
METEPAGIPEPTVPLPPRLHWLVRAATAAARAGTLAAVLLAGASALAQGGPPLVTDDPETPGNGRWEINLATIATRTPGALDLSIPDADINYGWGDRVQLKADLPWAAVRDTGQGWRAGPGTGQFGVKWRFLDRDDAGIAVSTYPQFGHSLSPVSTRRGIAPAGHGFFLPLEAATEIAGFGVDAEIGRNSISGATGQWEAGLIGAHACGAGVECLAEVRETVAPHSHQTLLNLGLRWRLDESLALLFAAGHESGSSGDDPRRSLVYVGFQFTH